MTYKQSETYGTTLGGCLSCTASIFILFYVSLNLWQFLFQGRNYNVSSQTLVFSTTNPYTFELSPTDVIPVVQIMTVELPSLQQEYNNLDNFKLTFRVEERYASDTKPFIAK